MPWRSAQAGPTSVGRECQHRTVTAAPSFPPWFFERGDERPDDEFYAVDRLVTHIDDGAIAAVGDLYEELGLDGEVLDLCSSWVSHFRAPPRRLVALGMNTAELAANGAATERLVHDLNADPALPFPAGSFDAVTCCVSVDYLTRPLEVFAEVARVLRDGSPFVCTFSNRCFPTKAIRGWLVTDDAGHAELVGVYFDATVGFGPSTAQHRNPGARARGEESLLGVRPVERHDDLVEGRPGLFQRQPAAQRPGGVVLVADGNGKLCHARVLRCRGPRIFGGR